MDPEFYRGVVESVREYGIFTVDPTGLITSWNRGARAIFGYEESEIVGSPFDRLFVPEDRARGVPMAEVKLALETGRAPDERWHLRKSGERFWASGLAFRLEKDGKAVGTVKVVRDRTEAKHIEEIKREGALESSLIDYLPTLVAYIDRDLRYRVANHAFENWLGKPLDEITGRTMPEVLGEKAFSLLQPRVRAALGGRRQDFEAAIPYVGQTERWVRITYIPHADATDQVNGLVAITIDISELKKLETELRTRAARGESRLEELGQLIDASHDAIFIRDMDDRIRYWNKGAYEMYGFTAEEAVGARSHELLRTIFPEPLERISSQLGETGRWEGTIVQTRLDGTRLDATSRWVLQKDADGRPRAVLEVNRDITKLRNALTALQRTNRSLEELTYVSAHHMQEPLRKIANYSELLSRRYQGRLDPDADAYLAQLTEGAKRLKTVISGVVAFSRVGREEGVETTFALEDVVGRILRELKGELERIGAAVDVGPLPRVRGLQHQFETLMRQLLLNAIAFRRPSAPLVVVIRAEETPHGTAVSVKDNGAGVDPKLLPNIFEPFKTLRLESGEGAGLGLALCRRIVEHHGGVMSVRSAPGSGSTFTFELPRARVQPR